MQLVVTEKPSVAQAISHVIGAKERKDGYMEGNGFLVSWCVGHLVELAQPEMYSEAWKKWSYESLPMIPEQWQHEVKKETATQYKILKNLMHDTRVESVVCATDAGREGELIFRLVYEQAGCGYVRIHAGTHKRHGRNPKLYARAYQFAVGRISGYCD